MIASRNLVCQWLPIETSIRSLRSPASSVRRVSSLSAIHRGLRRSNSSGSQAAGRDPDVSEHVTERRRARLAAGEPTFKIHKGKKDITETFQPEPTGKSAQFYNPDDPFGKNSAVYKYKTGQLQGELETLKAQKRTRERGAEDGYATSQNAEWSRMETSSGEERGREVRTRTGSMRRADDSWTRPSRDRPGSFRREASPRRDGHFERPRAPRERDERDSHPGDSREMRMRTLQDRPSRGWKESSNRGDDSKDRIKYSERLRAPRERDGRASRPRVSSEPRMRASQDRPSKGWKEYFDQGDDSNDWAGIRGERGSRNSLFGSSDSLPFTTAASQFLYGKSVVEAALKTGRRKLYKLYIYQGANRENVVQDKVLQALAFRRGVDSIILRERDQRLMDKVSQGRPHNGYILEASPLPQLPVRALGELSASEDRPGYSVSLGHQSHEEAQVNGRDDFVPASPGKYKPFVLFLDGVRDPGNLGAILRSASFLGINAVAISNRTSTSLTPVALKASAGSSETMTLFSVDSPADFLTRSREAGWKVFAAVPTAEKQRPTRQMDLRDLETEDPLADGPCILLVGSEGDGLPRQLRSKADVEVTIPNHSGSKIVDSLNVSVAAGLLCSSFVKGRMYRVMPSAEDELGLFG